LILLSLSGNPREIMKKKKSILNSKRNNRKFFYRNANQISIKEFPLKNFRKIFFPFSPPLVMVIKKTRCFYSKQKFDKSRQIIVHTEKKRKEKIIK